MNDDKNIEIDNINETTLYYNPMMKGFILLNN